MPPKKQEKKEVKQIFDDIITKLWWEYSLQTEDQIQQIQDFFTNFQNELKELLVPDNFTLSCENLAKAMGVLPHPSFYEANRIQKLNEDPAQEENEEIQLKNFLMLQNMKFDYVSLRIVLHVFSQFPEMIILKFSNNEFDEPVANLLFNYISDPQNRKLQRLFFDWNPLSKEQKLKYIPMIANSGIEFLVLRSNQINDQTIKAFCQAILANPNCVLKHLELYDNRFGDEGQFIQNQIREIGALLESYNKIEYLSLAQNNIDSVQRVKPILQQIGKQVLTEQQLQQHRAIEKQREDMLAEAKKKKKKINEEDLPQVQQLIDLGDGKMAKVKNAQMKMLNLSMNPIQDSDIQLLDTFMETIPEEFQVIIVNTKIDKKSQDKLRIKYKQKMII